MKKITNDTELKEAKKKLAELDDNYLDNRERIEEDEDLEEDEKLTKIKELDDQIADLDAAIEEYEGEGGGAGNAD